mmetsp:Transcript_32412/g.100255  ORF Transcript_32412/g.100255 Transcript_32412/m.100255 type:complete len:298 (-) Transcript_32412:933-1826(-)
MGCASSSPDEGSRRSRAVTRMYVTPAAIASHCRGLDTSPVHCPAEWDPTPNLALNRRLAARYASADDARSTCSGGQATDEPSPDATRDRLATRRRDAFFLHGITSDPNQFAHATSGTPISASGIINEEAIRLWMCGIVQAPPVNPVEEPKASPSGVRSPRREPGEPKVATPRGHDASSQVSESAESESFWLASLNSFSAPWRLRDGDGVTPPASALPPRILVGAAGHDPDADGAATPAPFRSPAGLSGAAYQTPTLRARPPPPAVAESHPDSPPVLTVRLLSRLGHQSPRTGSSLQS